MDRSGPRGDHGSMVDWFELEGGVLDDLFTAEAAGGGLPDCGDRYEMREIIGKGGQGVVYGAFDRAVGREVAIKRLHDPGADQRLLLNEARTLGRMAHPAIPQIYDQGRSPDGGHFVVMQRIVGRRLQDVLPDLPDDSARLRLFRSIAGAVRHAHGAGILHRDLKPENLLVTDEGEPYIVDWGLAANGGPRAVCGSPHFAAPEQLDGQVADRRADVFALGVLLYVILCGELPYGRAVRNFAEFRQLRAGLQRVPLRRRRPDLPAALERICDTAMAAQPAARYARVDALLDDLDALAAGRPLARDIPRLPWRRSLVWLLPVVSGVAGLCLGLVLADDEPPRSSAPPLVERQPERLLAPPLQRPDPVDEVVQGATEGWVDLGDLPPLDLPPPPADPADLLPGLGLSEVEPTTPVGDAADSPVGGDAGETPKGSPATGSTLATDLPVDDPDSGPVTVSDLSEGDLLLLPSLGEVAAEEVPDEAAIEALFDPAELELPAIDDLVEELDPAMDNEAGASDEPASRPAANP